MNPYAGDVPVESAEDWHNSVIKPARLGFESVGVPVSDLTDEQVMTASERIVEKFGGEMPDLIEIGVIVDAVRFEARLNEAMDGHPASQDPLVQNLNLAGWQALPLTLVPRRPSVDLLAARRAARTKRRLPSGVPHAACRTAYADGGDACSRCCPLLHVADCSCHWCDYWNEHADDGALDV